jgi:hypothetical protein
MEPVRTRQVRRRNPSARRYRVPARRHAGPLESAHHGLALHGPGYSESMLYTIFIILAIIALALFIFGRR